VLFLLSTSSSRFLPSERVSDLTGSAVGCACEARRDKPSSMAPGAWSTLVKLLARSCCCEHRRQRRVSRATRTASRVLALGVAVSVVSCALIGLRACTAGVPAALSALTSSPLVHQAKELCFSLLKTDEPVVAEDEPSSAINRIASAGQLGILSRASNSAGRSGMDDDDDGESVRPAPRANCS